MWSSLVSWVESTMVGVAEGWGLPLLAAIAAVTALVRLALIPATAPLTVRSRTWRQIQRGIRPALKDARTRHKGDPLAANEAVKRLHEEAGIGVVDMSGVLLAFVQLPVLIALFQATLGLTEGAGGPTERVLLGAAASLVSLLSAWLADGKPKPLAMAAYAILPLIFVLWLGTGMGAYLAAFYGATLVQSVLIRWRYGAGDAAGTPST